MGRFLSHGITITFFLMSCGDDDNRETDDTSNSAGGADTRFHPPPNGLSLAEADACLALRDAVTTRALALNCSKTVRTCPAFLRVLAENTCNTFDEGTVKGCAEFIQQAPACDKLDESLCVVQTLDCD